MKYALVNGRREIATAGARGTCQGCGAEMIAKCGPLVIDHWAHNRLVSCDTWWENETEWHRNWKNNFPDDCQEIAFTDSTSGERHIADIYTPEGWAVEFQHSFIKPEERLSRNMFYEKLIWVVDATRRKTDPTLLEMANQGKPYFKNNTVDLRKVDFDMSFHRLLREWWTDDAHIFLDFGRLDSDRLWYIFQSPKEDPHRTHEYISALSKRGFINLLVSNCFEKFVTSRLEPLREWIREEEKRRWDKMVEESAQEFEGIRRLSDWPR